MLTPEKKMKILVSKMLNSFGEDVWHFSPANNGFGKSGIPDIIVCAFGCFFGIEVKADETKKATRLQELQGERIQQAGGEWFLVRSKEDINMVEENIKAIMHMHLLAMTQPEDFPQVQ